MVAAPRRLAATLFLCCALVARPSSAAEASLDRDTVGFGESFVLTIEAKTSDDPDLGPLAADFDVLGTSKRSQISVVNGHFNKSSSWQINLMARREGDLVIPPLKVGDERTAALAIHVIPSAAGGTAAKELFMEVEVTPRDPYVQAQCLYTLRVLADSRWDVDNPNLDDPKTDAGAAIIKKLGKDRITQTTRGGKRYDVLERIYAIYPQRAGDLVIPPVAFQGQISRGGGLLLDPFSGAMSTRRLLSSPVTLHVKPIPAAFAGRAWLPARSLQLHETWSDDPENLRAGEPVTRTISLLANGLTAAQLPEFDAIRVAGLKTYADQPLLDDQIHPSGITGLRQQKIAVIAGAGDVALPEIRIPWWNTGTDRMEEAVLPARVLHVIAAVTAPNPRIQTTPPVVTRPQPRNNGPPAPTPRPAPPWLALGLGLGWLLTLLSWWWSGARTRRRRAEALQHRRQKERALLQAAVAACNTGDPRRCRGALLDWAGARWPDHPPQGLAAIEKREPSLSGPIDELNRALYSKDGQQWHGGALAAALENLGHAKPPPLPAAPPPALEPLFRA